MRGIISVPKGLDSDALLCLLKENERFRSILEKPVKKVILVKDKIANIIM
jgi:sulfur transfer complex TusBCD TusB component (DsrH family)